MIKKATETLTAESTTQEFVVELAKNIASFITMNRAAFSQDDDEAVSEYLTAITISEVRARALDFVANPRSIQDDGESSVQEVEKKEPTDSDSDEPLPEPKPAGDGDDLVPEDVMKLLDE